MVGRVRMLRVRIPCTRIFPFRVLRWRIICCSLAIFFLAACAPSTAPTAASQAAEPETLLAPAPTATRAVVNTATTVSTATTEAMGEELATETPTEPPPTAVPEATATAIPPLPTTSSEEEAGDGLPSDQGLFLVSYSSALDPSPINRMHSWTLHVETADGEPVEGAAIKVDGGMPEHGHGLPTQPQVTDDLGNGNYRVEGMKFSMPGYWIVTFDITAGEQHDNVTFEMTLN